MKIWVDADACPGVIKEILFRVAERRSLQVTLVANQLLRVPGSRFITALQVPQLVLARALQRHPREAVAVKLVVA